MRGDVTDLSMFADKSFDIAFSNSVIEHLPTAESQLKMVHELKRVAGRYYLQTPNYWFPFEVHFLLPLFHFLPRAGRIWFLSRLGAPTTGAGWRRIEERLAAEYVDSIRLLTKSDLERLFGPSSRVLTERFFLLPKSLICIGDAP
ncbi:MAG: class I SAM-dependent methyltransferase [Deltaproteobacteria bacterium]|nr:class I SAM-dependent methyltransferase [Deltaproteobacteria bacterium]